MSQPTHSTEPISMARLFPLSNVVLFPYGVLPLHIFEPRYRQMTRDALADDRRIAMVLPSGGMNQEPVPIHQVACIGRIHQENALPDGRFTFLLHGEARVLVERELPLDRMYRVAKVQVLDDALEPNLATRRQLQRAHILSLFRQVLPEAHPSVTRFFESLAADVPPGAFADMVAYASPLPMEIKQQLLATPSVDRRLEVLAGALEEIREGGSDPSPDFLEGLSLN
ncbi:MAG: LON peptidase substrate-binding domain-containing protein [Planctomycetota bacterium]